MADDDSAEGAVSSRERHTNLYKQAACYACRKSKVKCQKLPGMTSCQKCVNTGIECVIPSYHVGRYKGVKNKRSGLEKAIYQVEKAVKKARMEDTATNSDHTLVLQRLIQDSRDSLPRSSTNTPSAQPEQHTAQIASWSSTRAPTFQGPPLESVISQPVGVVSSGQELDNDGDVTVNNANNPLQLLAIASAIPESNAGSSPSESDQEVSPMTTTGADLEDDDRTQDFFRPMMSKFDVGQDLDPIDLGLVSHSEVKTLFEL